MQNRFSLCSVLLSFSCLLFAACGGRGSFTAQGAASSSTSSIPSTNLFPNAKWLTTAPTGGGSSIAFLNAGFLLNDHKGGFDYPEDTADGSHGWYTFHDGYGNTVSVPVPVDGFHPSVGGWGYNDGHLVILDLATRTYYDFWKLNVDSSGNPTSDQVGQIQTGSLDGQGTPGDTAAGITGAAGDVLPQEFSTGIHHALNCIVPEGWNNSSLGHQAPAVKTDGQSSSGVLSEGAKIGIDPSIDLTTLGLGKDALTLMTAVQQYGCVITDQNGGTNAISIYSAVPDESSLDLTGLDKVGPYLRLYM